MSRKNKTVRRNTARKEVQQRGSSVLNNELFRRCLKQKHHTVTVGEHSIGVAEDALIIADVLEKIGLHADRDSLVRSSLCHDLGMLGRYEKYRSDMHTCVRHPGESLKITKEMYPDLNDQERDSILHHMFPVLPIPPHTLEGLIVCLADKKSAIREELFHRNKKEKETAGRAAADSKVKGKMTAESAARGKVTTDSKVKGKMTAESAAEGKVTSDSVRKDSKV